MQELVTSPAFARGCLCGLVLEALKHQRVLNMEHVDLDVSAAGNHGQCDYASLCYLRQDNLIRMAYIQTDKQILSCKHEIACKGMCYTHFFNFIR